MCLVVEWSLLFTVKLVLFTNGQSHRGFRLVPKSVTSFTMNGVMTTDARYLCGNWAFRKNIRKVCTAVLVSSPLQHCCCHVFNDFLDPWVVVRTTLCCPTALNTHSYRYCSVFLLSYFLQINDDDDDFRWQVVDDEDSIRRTAVAAGMHRGTYHASKFPQTRSSF